MSASSTSRPSTARANALIRRYHEDGDRQARNDLILLFAPMVRHIAFQRIRTLPSHCDADDYIVAGLEALTAAADRFDPAKGVSFEQYAWTRVQGAIMDELRREDWAPRTVRRFARNLQNETGRLAAANGRAPSEDELAEVLGVSTDDLAARRRDIAGAQVLSLNAPVHAFDGSAVVERQETLASSDMGQDPETAATRAEALRRFRKAFELLGEREREVALKLYVANKTLREIGEDLGVSESRVCQIHRQLRSTLHHELRDDAELFEAVG